MRPSPTVFLRRALGALLLASLSLVLVQCGGGGDGGSGPAAPEIALSDHTVLFLSVVSGEDPAPQLVQITNAGGGALSGLVSTVTYDEGNAADWLTASLHQSAAPSTLELIVTASGLLEGSYTAAVDITSGVATNSPKRVDVNLTVTSGDPISPPAAPRSLSASAVSSSQIALSWADNSGDESGFKVERCAGATCADFAEIGLVAANVTDYLSGSLTGATTYRYRVRAYNGGGNSSFSNIASAATSAAPAVPPAPTSLVATAVSTTEITLTWTDNASTETGFRIERCLGATCSSFVELATVAANVVSFTNTGLESATAYNYRVRAYNATGNSAFSNSAAATTLPPAPPAAPTGLTATAASGTAINLAWTDNSTNETVFEIESCSGATCTDFAKILQVAANVTTVQHSGLIVGSTHRYRVRAFNQGGASSYSNTETATTLVPVPSAPTALTAVGISDSRIDLSWTDNAGNETGYRIDRCAGPSCTDFAEIATVAANATSYQSTGLTASTAYSYRVRAYNASGNSSYSNTATATTAGAPVPAAPSNLVATTASTSQINLTWTDNASNETGFRVEQCAGASCTNFTEIGTAPTNATGANITSLTAGTIYRYRVRAYNGAGNSAFSNIAQATTEAAITVLASADNLVLVNSADATVANTVYANAENAAGYNYYYTSTTYTSYLGAASLLKFDVQTQIAGKTIVEAKLLLHEQYAPGDQNGIFTLAAMGSAWNPATMTWNVYATTSYFLANTVNFQASSTTTIAPREFNITAIVQNWANGTWANNGLTIFDATSGTPGYASYQILGFDSMEVYNQSSRRPQLYIRYR